MINLKEYNQEQILRFYDTLNNEEKEILNKQINKIDFNLMNNLYKNSFKDDIIDINKISNLKIISSLTSIEEYRYEEVGKNLVKNNEYAVVLFAGGFGSRLNINTPKGCLKLTINNKKISLFEIFVNQLKKVCNDLNCKIRLYIMTSTINSLETITFFKDNNFFGYEKSLISFFRQNELPILDTNGKIVLKNKHEILFGPNGNGDVFSSMKKSNILLDMKKNNIKYVLFSTIDNVLTNLIDFKFIGTTIEKGYKLATKTLFKENPDEKDWIFCKYNDHPFMLPGAYQNEKINNKKDSNGNFKYREKNITYHLISLSEIEKYSNLDLKYHRAYKKNDFINDDGDIIKNISPNSFKFEKFIFDAFYYSENMLLYRTNESEFCPIKKKEDILIAEKILNEKCS